MHISSWPLRNRHVAQQVVTGTFDRDEVKLTDHSAADLHPSGSCYIGIQSTSVQRTPQLGLRSQ